MEDEDGIRRRRQGAGGFGMESDEEEDGMNLRDDPVAYKAFRRRLDDQEEQRDLGELREASALNAAHARGEIYDELEFLKDLNTHVEMGLDPDYFDFGTLAAPSEGVDAEATPEAFFESLKPELMEAMQVEDEEEWQEITQEPLQEFRENVPMPSVLQVSPAAQEAALKDILQKLVPQDHPRHALIMQQLSVIGQNPTWDFARRAQFVQRAASNLA
jgi:hypothetical protein